MSDVNEIKVKKSWGSGGLFKSRELGSLMLLLITPTFCITFWYTCYAHKGSFIQLFNQSYKSGLPVVIKNMWQTPFDPNVCKKIALYMVFELALVRLIPGKIFKGSPTPSGHIPVYKANGIQSYVITILTLLVIYNYNLFNPAEVYDNMGKFLSSMNLFALLFCLFLVFKGLNFPSTSDSGSNGSLIIDYFWGTELYPRIFGWDVKQFTNCRFGMMFWQIAILCYAVKQYQTIGYISSSMLVSVALQTVYIAKFFWWETGYFCSMDIQHDRAGFYLCWGCLVWVPSMYTIHTYFLVEHPINLSIPTTVAFLLAGTFCIWCNYDCDRQRQDFRNSGGKLKIWGKPPIYIEGKYKIKTGEVKTALILASGWWGISRHFHYIPEVAASFFWCVPALFEYPTPYFYPIYLALVLIDRAWRDDARCADKYTTSWDKYCEKVPFKLIPGIV